MRELVVNWPVWLACLAASMAMACWFDRTVKK